MSDIVIYEDGNVELKATVESESIWLRQNEIATLFDKDRTVITRHINNILKDNEVDEKSNVQKMHIAKSDKPVKFYSLDIILAVGYRTNSAKAIKFRQWATKVLKDYVIKGHPFNDGNKRIGDATHKRLPLLLSITETIISFTLSILFETSLEAMVKWLRERMLPCRAS